VLLSKRCPHTGVVNFFEASEPHIAIGSITKCGTSAAGDSYAWRFYGVESTRAGRAPDASTAERTLRALLFRCSAERNARPAERSAWLHSLSA